MPIFPSHLPPSATPHRHKFQRKTIYIRTDPVIPLKVGVNGKGIAIVLHKNANLRKRHRS